jgi:phosphotransferase system enzyme I (PtsI)
MGVPAVVACAGATGIPPGVEVLVDGTSGEVRPQPVPAVRFVGEAVGSGDAGGSPGSVVPVGSDVRQATFAGRSGPGRTHDGHPVPLLANIGGPADLDAALAAGAEGVGLYRTEFLFLDRAEVPCEEEQERAYRAALDAFPGGRVIVRTLDSGADKPLSFVPPPPAEPNPALGERGLRMFRRYPEVMASQLGALSRAAVGAPAELLVMAPMVARAAEAAWFAGQCRARGLAPVGVMIEIPAAALRARDIVPVVDFVSIGTNDLAQYAFAADRQSSALGALQDPWHPALLDLVAMAASAASGAGKPSGVCGEAAGDPALACVFAGLGVTTLSMGPAAMPAVRAGLAEHTLDQCRLAARAARAETTPEHARAAARANLPGLAALGL